MTANVGGQIGTWITSGEGVGRVANVGEVNVYTTRAEDFNYVHTRDGIRETWSAVPEYVFQIDANCKDETECAAIKSNDATPVTRGPVILVHGFTLFQSVGGGKGTWGSLASALKASGHPVFELRWNTYMRFEEAAGVLSALSRRVAEITRHKVTVVAHSFGGVVAHLSMMGQGIRYQGGNKWNSVPVDGVFQRLITLGAPLSGIRETVNKDYGLTTGRDAKDDSITKCEAITCFQAGSSDEWDADEIGELTDKVTAFDSRRIGLSDMREGETIRTLHDAWEDGRGHAVPFATVVSLKWRPDDYFPDLTNATAYKLGDGLISIMGQAVLPRDFSTNPYEPSMQYDLAGTLGADFLGRLDSSFAAPMEKRTLNGRDYYFALRAAHSCAQRGGAIEECGLGIVHTAFNYLIANYSANGATIGRVKVSDLAEAAHPLWYFIESSAHLAEPRSPYPFASEAPVAVVRARVVRDGLPLAGERVSFQIEDAATQAPISDTEVPKSSSDTGELVFDAGAALAARFPGQLLNVANFNVIVRAGDGWSTKPYSRRWGLFETVEIGDIDLTLLPEDALVAVAGKVIDGQTESSPIAGADIYLKKGVGWSAREIRPIQDTTTSRHVFADDLGRFSASGLEPGEYSALVTKLGYLDQTQGTVLIAADGSSSLTFSLLRVLTGDQAAITLRWGAATDGPSVSSDLDSHLKKLDSADVQQYEIYYAHRVGSTTDSLDRDDIDYQGPETITLSVDNTARYVYFVHNYAAGNGSLLGPSGATVSIRIGDTLRDFSLPPGEGGTQRYWKVFEIINGAVVPCASACLLESAP